MALARTRLAARSLSAAEISVRGFGDFRDQLAKLCSSFSNTGALKYSWCISGLQGDYVGVPLKAFAV